MEGCQTHLERQTRPEKVGRHLERQGRPQREVRLTEKGKQGQEGMLDTPRKANKALKEC